MIVGMACTLATSMGKPTINNTSDYTHPTATLPPMRIPLTFLLLAGCVASTKAADTPEAIEHFEKHVRPILVEHCVKCHGEKKQQAGLRLDNAAGLKKGADSGAVVVPGEPGKSSMVASIRRSGDYPMPPDKELSKDQIAVLEMWIITGAVFPAGSAHAIDANAAKKHWAFQPIRDPKVPAIAGATEIDRFLNAKVAEKGLKPAQHADKRTLARRLYYDLLGLPPTAEELDRFEKDSDPQAYAKLVDTLLASPHYGERWGRYWLDLARYADTKGYVFNEDRAYPYAYTFRDYVVRSFWNNSPGTNCRMPISRASQRWASSRSADASSTTRTTSLMTASI
jgi:mono/diheme cytochrome c family protein